MDDFKLHLRNISEEVVEEVLSFFAELDKEVKEINLGFVAQQRRSSRSSQAKCLLDF